MCCGSVGTATVYCGTRVTSDQDKTTEAYCLKNGLLQYLYFGSKDRCICILAKICAESCWLFTLPMLSLSLYTYFKK